MHDDSITRKKSGDDAGLDSLPPRSSGLSIGPLDLFSTRAARDKSFSELSETVDKVRRAVTGFERLKSRAHELEERAGSLEQRIAHAGGASAAARALGLDDPGLDDKTKISDLEVELQKLRTELRETRAAVNSAPALMPALLSRLESALGAASETENPLREAATAWIEQARRLVDDLHSEMTTLQNFLVAITPPTGFIPPLDCRSISVDDLQSLKRQRATLDEARALIGSLTPAPAVSSADDWEEKQRRTEAKNYEARLEWERTRGLR